MRASKAYDRGMDQHEPFPQGIVTFTDAEIAGIKAAIADAEERGCIPNEEVDAWLNSLDTDNPLPEPQPRKDF